MASVIRHLPITDSRTPFALPGGGVIEAKHDQIVLWLSVTRPGLAAPSPSMPRFPAVLDTGFNGTFLISESHLQDWAGMRLAELTWFDFLVAAGQALPVCDLDLWLYPNQPYSPDPQPGKPPVRLESLAGIAIWPAGIPGSRRLPLIGLRALRRAALQVHIDGRRGLVTIGRSHWWSSLGLVR